MLSNTFQSRVKRASQQAKHHADIGRGSPDHDAPKVAQGISKDVYDLIRLRPLGTLSIDTLDVFYRVVSTGKSKLPTDAYVRFAEHCAHEELWDYVQTCLELHSALPPTIVTTAMRARSCLVEG